MAEAIAVAVELEASSNSKPDAVFPQAQRPTFNFTTLMEWIEMQITQEHATKVLSVVDAGLCHGVGRPEPGFMCVEAAVCYALGLPFGDDPECVSRALRSLKIRLNDSSWSSDKARAKGLRRLALIQLGSRDALDDKEFVNRVVELAIRKSVPIALRAAASIHKDSNHKAALLAAADKCEKDGDKKSAQEANKIAADADAAYATAAYAYAAYAYAAYAYADATADATATADAYAAATAYAYAAYATAYAYAASKNRDAVLSEFAEDVVQILISMNVPGAQWLDLAPVEAVQS